MKKILLATAIASLFMHAAQAQEAAPAAAPVPDNQVAFNAAFSSDYRFRGISQSRLDPAISGGVDYTNNPTGLYVGTWLSSIKWINDAGGDSDIEYDLYAGKRGEIVKDVTYDVGVLRYFYPSNALAVNADTTEVYGQVGYGPAYLKYSHAVTNIFGFEDSKNSGYLDASANIDVGAGYTLNLHAGHQKIKGDGNDKFSYTDWKVGVTKEFYGVTVSLAAVGTNADDGAYVGKEGENLAKTGAVISLSKTF
jgi:uncharacterized protein (TIGR02001 family)